MRTNEKRTNENCTNQGLGVMDRIVNNTYLQKKKPFFVLKLTQVLKMLSAMFFFTTTTTNSNYAINNLLHN